MLTDLEKKVAAAVQADIPLTTRPFRQLAAEIGIDEETFIETLERLCSRGIIRRFGATLRHQKSGFNANAMVAWCVDEDRIDDVGTIMTSFAEVSHCYRRDPGDRWPYNLYTMIHAADKQSCLRTAREMSRKARVDRFTVLFSLKELKKTSMAYFSTNDVEED
ncbi:MAG: Lrp/AsnC family transcriptional regulator [Desulfobacterales bacterium]